MVYNIRIQYERKVNKVKYIEYTWLKQQSVQATGSLLQHFIMSVVWSKTAHEVSPAGPPSPPPPTGHVRLHFFPQFEFPGLVFVFHTVSFQHGFIETDGQLGARWADKRKQLLGV